MIYTFDILRRKSAQDEAFHQSFDYETEDPNETVATALIAINRQLQLKGEDTIAWEAGCLQKKCGACAMLINHYPALACDSFLKDMERKKIVFLAPLSKFPVVKDLVTDRRVMFANLQTLNMWSGESAEIREKDLDKAYDASRCLQCGCCLEVCPNFYPGGDFFGAAGFAPEGRLISTYSDEEKQKIRQLYKVHVYDGCGKSLACEKVCPAQIDLDRLMSRSNAAAVWRRG